METDLVFFLTVKRLTSRWSIFSAHARFILRPEIGGITNT